jgi:hypothetical protein
MTHIITFEKDYFNNYDFYITNNNIELVSIFMNIDTPIKEFVSKEYIDNKWYTTNTETLINQRVFIHNGVKKLTITEDESDYIQSPTYLDKLLQKELNILLVNGKLIKPNNRLTYQTDRIKAVLRDIQLKKILTY